jgi:hypothetical protein
MALATVASIESTLANSCSALRSNSSSMNASRVTGAAPGRATFQPSSLTTHSVPSFG